MQTVVRKDPAQLHVTNMALRQLHEAFSWHDPSSGTAGRCDGKPSARRTLPLSHCPFAVLFGLGEFKAPWQCARAPRFPFLNV
eukprot:6174405-Pleurochrysis_carterae.AAC.3